MYLLKPYNDSSRYSCQLSQLGLISAKQTYPSTAGAGIAAAAIAAAISMSNTVADRILLGVQSDKCWNGLACCALALRLKRESSPFLQSSTLRPI